MRKKPKPARILSPREKIASLKPSSHGGLRRKMQFDRREARKTLPSYTISLGVCRPFRGDYSEKLQRAVPA